MSNGISGVFPTESSYNTEFPQLEDDACSWDAAGTPKRYPKPYAKDRASMREFSTK